MNEINSLRLYIKCNNEVELKKRKIRKGNSLERNDEQINKLFKKRNSQFVSNVLPNIDKFNVILESDKDYAFKVVKEGL